MSWREQRRDLRLGLDFQEDLYNPFVLEFALSRRVTATVIAATSPYDPGTASLLRKQEIARRKAIVDASPSKEANRLSGRISSTSSAFSDSATFPFSTRMAGTSMRHTRVRFGRPASRRSASRSITRAPIGTIAAAISMEHSTTLGAR